ncbi:hypothetical protein Ple7327_2998 [Pleurocapsa sp. PCC 7327]|uniref:hypothetical protein n=1 Tax=Pleurocapsa sp. PCC 7327 TaxID=118163 RepID=UPI00029FB4F9|nr:hypothetical protein [Pleurocapsa sp. PCC 7327]AFY78232.1 hypothetical protein Ple7327_2998 [Pleurocapsa sp. PCC 7327]
MFAKSNSPTILVACATVLMGALVSCDRAEQSPVFPPERGGERISNPVSKKEEICEEEAAIRQRYYNQCVEQRNQMEGGVGTTTPCEDWLRTPAACL